MNLYLIDECDYIAANSEQEAKDFYKKEIGLSEEEFSEVEFEEVPKERWPQKTISEFNSSEQEYTYVPFSSLMNEAELSGKACIVASCLD